MLKLPDFLTLATDTSPNEECVDEYEPVRCVSKISHPELQGAYDAFLVFLKRAHVQMIKLFAPIPTPSTPKYAKSKLAAQTPAPLPRKREDFGRQKMAFSFRKSDTGDDHHQEASI